MNDEEEEGGEEEEESLRPDDSLKNPIWKLELPEEEKKEEEKE